MRGSALPFSRNRQAISRSPKVDYFFSQLKLISYNF